MSLVRCPRLGANVSNPILSETEKINAVANVETFLAQTFLSAEKKSRPRKRLGLTAFRSHRGLKPRNESGRQWSNVDLRIGYARNQKPPAQVQISRGFQGSQPDPEVLNRIQRPN